MERLTGVKPTLGCSGKAEGEAERVRLLLWNKVRHFEGYKVNFVCFIELRGIPNELFCCHRTLRWLESE